MKTPSLLIVLAWSTWASLSAAECDNPRSPACRSGQRSDNGDKREKCNSMWLIPRSADNCLVNRNAPEVVKIESKSVKVTPNPIELPGCFTIEMKAEIRDQPSLPRSYFSKVEYNWLNLPNFQNFNCQNSSSNGCGGYGNNCYYCDICNSIQKVRDGDSGSLDSSIVQQFKDVKCPESSGQYTVKKQYCFNDFKDFDKNGDCEFDFLEEEQFKNYKQLLKDLQQSGFGTLQAKFMLAHNATANQTAWKAAEEKRMLDIIDKELEKKRLEMGWNLNDQQYQVFRDWYVNYRRDSWHKSKYLPWLLFQNQVACLLVSFDICEKKPSPSASTENADTWSWGSAPQWQCV